MHQKVERIIRKILTILEVALAVVTLIVMVGNLGMEAYRIIIDPTYFPGTEAFLHSILSIAVGLEFVRMLVDMTPANTLEVLIVAISRHVILTHDDPWTILVCVVSIAALFATRHFLIPKAELAVEMSEVVDDEAEDEEEEEEEEAEPAEVE